MNETQDRWVNAVIEIRKPLHDVDPDAPDGEKLNAACDLLDHITDTLPDMADIVMGVHTETVQSDEVYGTVVDGLTIDKEEFLRALQEQFKAFPEYRIGQLLVNALGGDPYYMSDEDARRHMEAYPKDGRSVA